MKFVISTQELNFLIARCQNAVSQKPTTPLLANLLVEAKNGELNITGTDLAVGIRCTTEAKVIEKGTTTLPTKRLAPLIRELTAANVEISTNEHHVTEIMAGSSRFLLNGMNGKEFPPLPNLSGSISFKMSQADLKDLLFRTSFAVSREDSRQALMGVFLHVAEGKLLSFGADGKRLARVQLPVSCDPTIMASLVVPLKGVEEIQKILANEGEVILYLMSDKIGVETESTLLISKLLTADYPDVSGVIPSNTEVVVTVHREELIRLLRQVSLLTPDECPVQFSFSEGELKLFANTREVGEGNVSMPVNYYGAPLEIAFDPRYFLDVLRHSCGERVNISLVDPYNPAIVTEEKTKENGLDALYVVMPMRYEDR